MTQDPGDIKDRRPNVTRIQVENSISLRYAGIFLAGVLLGWFVLGWWLFPVQYTEVYPNELRTDARNSYLQMAAESYAATGDIQEAAKRLRFWSQEELGPLLYARADALEADNPTSAAYMRDMAAALRLTASGQISGAQPLEEQAGAEDRLSSIVRVLLYALLVAMLVAVALYLWRRFQPGALRRTRLRPRRAAAPDLETDAAVIDADFAAYEPAEHATPSPVAITQPPTPRIPDEGDETTVTPPSFATLDHADAEPAQPGAPAPVSEAETSFETKPAPPITEPVAPLTPPDDFYEVFVFAGEPQYNQILSIEERESYLGEYGMGAGEAARNDPNQILSLEVWLFDKSDIRTVSAALVPPEIYDDEDQRSKIAAESVKEFVLLEPGAAIALETERLEVHGRVRRVDFGLVVDGVPTIRYAEVELSGRQRQ